MVLIIQAVLLTGKEEGKGGEGLGHLVSYSEEQNKKYSKE